MSGNFYRAFEERYRGSRDLIKGRLRAYAPFTDVLASIAPGARAIDLGCGRGEWLELSTEQGFVATGVDLDEGMLAACRERGLSVETADALETLSALADDSVAMITAFHLVEHLPFDAVQILIAQALRVLIPGGLLIMETPNPENLIVGTSNFYLDPSHVKPVPPMLLEFMVEYAGFPRQIIVRLQGGDAHDAPVGLLNVLQDVSADYAVVAQKSAAPEVLAHFDAAFQTDYGALLLDLAARFDNDLANLRERANAGGEAQIALTHVASRLAVVETTLSLADARNADAQQGLAGVAQALAVLESESAMRLSALDLSNAEMWGHAIPGIETRVASLEEGVPGINNALAALEGRLESDADERASQLTARLDELQAQSQRDIEALRAHVSDALEKIEQRNESRVSDVEERRREVELQKNRRFIELERRMANTDRRIAIPEMQLRETELQLARSQQELQRTQERARELEQQVAALLGSTSWSVTAPARALSALVLRLRSAVREGRLKSGLRRRLAASVLGSAAPDASWGLRPWLRHLKTKNWARRIALPLMQRSSRLNEFARHLAGAQADVAPPSGDIFLPDWPGPLPAEYPHLPAAARKVLLDLCRADNDRSTTN